MLRQTHADSRGRTHLPEVVADLNSDVFISKDGQAEVDPIDHPVQQNNNSTNTWVGVLLTEKGQLDAITQTTAQKIHQPGQSAASNTTHRRTHQSQEPTALVEPQTWSPTEEWAVCPYLSSSQHVKSDLQGKQMRVSRQEQWIAGALLLPAGSCISSFPFPSALSAPVTLRQVLLA